MDNRGKRQAASIFGGMGFYIALLVCAIAAGVVGYYALVSNEAEVQEQQVQTVAVSYTHLDVYKRQGCNHRFGF